MYFSLMKSLAEYLNNLPKELIDEMEQYGSVMPFKSGTEILRQGQYVKQIPLVLEGIVKVFTRQDEKELLLYYIESGESCIMSFTAGLADSPSKVFALTEENTLVLLMPADKMNQWLKTFPAINQLFYKLYNQRYCSLLETINDLLFNRLDQRLLNYLMEMSRHKNTKFLYIRHKQIAAEMGTVREVISRVLKKLELEGKIRQSPNGIEIV